MKDTLSCHFNAANLAICNPQTSQPLVQNMKPSSCNSSFHPSSRTKKGGGVPSARAAMSSTTENTFRSSLQSFNLSRSNRISLPTDNSNTAENPFVSIRSSASNLFSNVSNSIQGYLPLNSAEEEEEPWYQMSRVEVNSRYHTLSISCYSSASRGSWPLPYVLVSALHVSFWYENDSDGITMRWTTIDLSGAAYQAFFLFLPMIAVFPGKFAATFTRKLCGKI